MRTTSLTWVDWQGGGLFFGARQGIKRLGFRLAAALLRASALGLSYAGRVVRKARSGTNIYLCLRTVKRIVRTCKKKLKAKMDFELWLKWGVPIVGSVVTGIFGITGLWISTRQFSLGSQTAYREEYKFAKSFFEDIEANPKMHKFARQKGYQAMAGGRDLAPAVIEHLMTLPDPLIALQDYVASQSYLNQTTESTKRRLRFSGSIFATHRRRQFLSVTYGILFFAFYSLTFSPILLWLWNLVSAPVAISFAAMAVPIGIPFAAFFAIELRHLRRAMRLVKMQNDYADSLEIPDEDRD